MDMDDILVSSPLDSAIQPLKNVTSVEKISSHAVTSKMAGGGSEVETVQANRITQNSNEASKPQAIRSRGRPPYRNSTETNRFTIDKPNTNVKLLNTKSALNTISGHKESLKEPYENDAQKDESDISTELKMQTRAR